MERRTFLTAAGAAVAAGLGAKLAYDRKRIAPLASVLIARAASYDVDLEAILRSGLGELGVGPASIRGRSVLLKPNLVEPYSGAPHVNTHPAVVRAAAEVFRAWGARRVLVAEGPGHCRDAQIVLEQSRLDAVLAGSRLEFVDLNYDEIVLVPNRFGQTKLTQLALPSTLQQVDWIVSLPKMKTHHWAGVTLSMKNLFGVMPGIYYGWPKNVLHHAGIGRSILDINAAVRPHLAIVDGIIGMEGDGPIMGTPKHAGVLVMGTNLPAVDATCARLMKINPMRVEYLAGASGRLGPIAEENIEQRGEPIAALAQPFRLLDHPLFAILRS
jgi:uncharacterized protein (DUF362 family)